MLFHPEQYQVPLQLSLETRFHNIMKHYVIYRVD